MSNKRNKPPALKNVLQIVNGIEETINKEQLFLHFSELFSCNALSNVVSPISGGQDSAFWLFCLSFLQPQLAFRAKLIWCNHFWQGASFYTSLHIARCALSFSFPILGFLSFGCNPSPLFYGTVRQSYNKKKKDLFFKSTEQSLIKQQSKALSLDRICKTKAGSRAKQGFVGTPVLPPSSSKTKSFRRKMLSKSLYETRLIDTKPKPVYKPGLRPLQNRFLYATKACRARVKGSKQFIERTSENRARNWRHTTTARGTTFYESRSCVYGHTASDRVETTLFNLIRGSGKKGTTTLPWKQRYSDFSYNKFYPHCKQLVKNTHLRQCHSFTDSDAP